MKSSGALRVRTQDIFLAERKYRVEKKGLQNIAKQDPGRAWQNR